MSLRKEDGMPEFIYLPKIGITIPKHFNFKENPKFFKCEDFRQAVEFKLNEIAPFISNNRYSILTDITLGRLFAECVKEMNIYATDQETGDGSWWVFNQTWRQDIKSSQTARNIRIFAECLYKYANDKNLNSDLKSKILKLQENASRNKLLKDAAEECRIFTKQFEANKKLFVCENGTIDLNTMSFREHKAIDYCTRKAPVKFNPFTNDRLWEEFLNQVFENNKELIQYIQQVFGATLSGENIPEELYILHGMTRSGKGSLMSAIANVLGPYAGVADSEKLLLNRGNRSTSHNEWLATLAGKRLVYMDEIPINSTLNSNFIKQITGGTSMKASLKYGHEFEFSPQWHLFLMDNHNAKVEDDTLFQSDRLVIIPMNRHFSLEERDPELKSKLASEETKETILNWLLQGYRLFKQNGWKIKRPKIINDAIAKYREESSPECAFINKALVKDSSNHAGIPANEVYTYYVDWCSENNFYCLGKKEFYNFLRQEGWNVSSGASNVISIKFSSLKLKKDKT